MLLLNGNILETERFANNETKFKDFESFVVDGWNLLEFQYTVDQDLVELMFAKRHLDEYHVPCSLFIFYMPYSRMDRKIEGSLFTLKYVSDFINWLDFVKVVVMDPHSSKTMECLKRSRAVYPAKDWLPMVQAEVGFGESDCIVFPDKGAASRYAGIGYKNVCIFEKKRNPITCVIEDMSLKEGTVIPQSKCIIVDDICSKGHTIMFASELLKSAGASEIYLVVSHFEETAFSGQLLADDSPITRVYTSKSISSKPHLKVRYIDVDVRHYVYSDEEEKNERF